MKATATMLYNRSRAASAARYGGSARDDSRNDKRQGGVPINVGDSTIGAVAGSGAPGGDKDAACATAAPMKRADKLR
jgi:uncharacterized protein GlcG (DUF336 family)